MPPLINPDNTCCFTGHRPMKLPWRYDETSPACITLKEKIFDILQALHSSGIRHFICGMASGCDFYFAEAVLKLKDEWEDVTLEAAIPCETQTDGWNIEEKKRYLNILHQADYETLVQKEYTDGCMLKRNKYMIDNSSVLVAVFNGSIGGTQHTINYAKKKGLEILELLP